MSTSPRSSKDELIAHNLKVAEAHFHNENPESVDKALALYAPNIVWEAPFRGQVYTDPRDVKDAYMAIFRTVRYNKTTTLRRYATENFVFDDQIADLTVVGDEMPNLGFKKGDRISMRLVRLFELENGKLTREIAYEMRANTRVRAISMRFRKTQSSSSTQMARTTASGDPSICRFAPLAGV